MAESKTAVIVSDTSIKNQVATSITHMHVYDKLIIKTLHHAINVTSNKAELFTIKCSINQATQLDNINHIMVIIDLIYIVMNLFLRVGSKNNSCIRETQENLIEFLSQSSLPYIL